MRRFIFVLGLLAALVVFGNVALAAPSSQEQIIHIVQPGENLFRISLRYNTTISAIATANGIANVNLIYVGQRLVIPGPGAPAPTATPVPPGQPTPPPTDGTIYTVVRGDTLSSIARRFGT